MNESSFGCFKVGLVLISVFLQACVADFSIEKLGITTGESPAPVVVPPVNVDLRAEVAGAPAAASNQSKEEIQVSGVDVVSYLYKVGLASNTDCQQFSGYLEVLNLSPQILSLKGIDDGQVKLCVLGKNTLGEIQSLSQPTEKLWNKNSPPEITFEKANVIADAGTTDFTVSVQLSHRRQAITNVQLGYRGSFEAVTEHNLSFDDVISIPAGQLTGQKSFSITGSVPASFERYLSVYISNFDYPSSQPGDITAQNFTIRSTSGVRNPLAEVVGKFDNSCFRKENGSVFCWGSYSGNGSATPVAAPQSIGTNFASISRFDLHACGVKLGGLLYCWGNNSYGQVVSSGDKLVPTHVDTLKTYVQVSAGQQHTCGVTDQKKIFCWGRFDGGRLGTGMSGSGTSTTPTGITRNDLNWQFVSAGALQTCAIQDGTGHLWCWGIDDNDFYLPLSPLSGDQFEPVLLDSTDSYKFVNIGSFGGCAITVSGVLKCWGANYAGELAPHISGPLSELTTVDSGTTYLSISVGYETGYYAPHTCGITTTNALKCWGADYGYDYGYLGVFRYQWDDFNLPTVVGAGQQFKSVESLKTGGYAVSTAGDLFYWGNDTNYPNRPAMTSNDPIIVEPNRQFSQISTSSSMICGLDLQQEIYCLGFIWEGLPHFVKVNAGSAQFQSIHVGDRNLCAIDTTGYLWCKVGDNFEMIDTVRTYSKVIRFYSGYCALASVDKKIYCQGLGNSYGELGRGDYDPHTDFAPVLFGGDVIDFTYFNDHGCLIDSLNDVYCWGRGNSVGLLGNGTTGDSATPVKVSTTEKFSKISTNYYHTCGVTLGNNIYCWGSDNNNTLGDTLGVVSHSSVPQQADPGFNFQNVFTGEGTACGLTDADKLRCWGNNRYGNFMTSTPSGTARAPDNVFNSMNFRSIEMVYTSFDTDAQACSLTTDDDLVCWGGQSNYSIFSKPFHNPSLIPEIIFL